MIAAAANPLLPAGYDLLWTAVLVVTLALLATALWQALRSPAHSGTEQLLWALLIVAAPVLGALAWFALGRQRRHAAPPRRAADRSVA
uniref:PLDc N-terminal domain-containing protein n=1 Tax=Agrococcus chionoecetis TaxID=3153752 RepID=UPI003F50B0C4